MTQHEAHAVSLAAVVTTGTIGAIGYSSSGHVDVKATCIMTFCALAGVPLGSKLAFKLNSNKLSRVFSVFLLISGPVVPAMPYLVKSSSEQENNASARELKAKFSTLVYSVTGMCAGLASGLLGVGGGVVITPLLALCSPLPHHTVVGTSLAAMVLPSLLALSRYAQQGALRPTMAVALATGALVGSACGVLVSAHLSDDHLRVILAGGMIATGARMFFK